MPDRRHHVVIIGGGFAGLNAARALGGLPVDVTVVDRRNFHLFQPLLYQVATGSLSPGDICAPLRHILRKQRNTSVLLAEVTLIDTASRRVVLDGGGHESVAYDTLVVASGAANHYFGNDHWRRFAPALKSIEDATAIRGRIFSAFEAAEAESDPEERKAFLRFVVVGAGPTGVELAGALGEIARDTLRGNFRKIRPESAEILLVEGGPRLLPAFPPDLSDHAERALIRKGVRTRTNFKVTAIDEAGLTGQADEEKMRIPARTVIWAAGVRSSPLAAMLAEQTGAQMDRGGRLHVARDLSLPGHPEILVAGDLAYFEQDGKVLPGMCPVAMQQGRYVRDVVEARLAGKQPEPFRFVNKGTMATIGRHSAIADLGFVRFGGILAWLAWLFLHLLYIVGYRSRLSVMLQWGYQYLTLNRGSRLITREGSD